MSRPTQFMRRSTTLEHDGDPRMLDTVVMDGGVLQAPVVRDGLLIMQAEGAPPFLGCSLELSPAVELVQVIVGRQLTGALEVIGPGGTRRLFFEDGAYAGSSSRVPEDAFGQILWRAGRLSLDQVVIAIENAKASGMRIGAALVSLGYLLKAEVRPLLQRQAEAVFFAACVSGEGWAVFRQGSANDNPVRFFDHTRALLGRAHQRATECVALRKRIAPLDRPVTLGTPARSPLGEAETAIVQLVSSAKATQLTLRQLLHKSELGERAGLRALVTLIDEGILAPGEVAQQGDASGRLARLCEAVSLTLSALDEKGFGLGDDVRGFAASPPAGVPNALLDVDLSGAIAPEAALSEARRANASLSPLDLERSLLALLEHALFQAQETLDDKTAGQIVGDVAALRVFS